MRNFISLIFSLACCVAFVYVGSHVTHGSWKGFGLAVANEDETVRNLTHQFRNALAVVTGGNSSGSSFVAKLGRRTCLITNQHVVAGMDYPKFTLLDQSQIKVGTAAAAVDHDILVYGVEETTPAFEIMIGVDKEAKIGDRIAVLGNPDGSGVIHPLTGKIVGIGPNLVEISAEIVPGNSGSPVIHLATGKVIAIASYLTGVNPDFMEDQSKPAPIRRFCYRIDSVKSWIPVNWPSFTGEWKAVEDVRKRTEEFIRLLQSGLPYMNWTAAAINDNTLRTVVQRGQAEYGRALNDVERQTAISSVRRDLSWAANSDVEFARRQITFAVFGKMLDQEAAAREFINSLVMALPIDGVQVFRFKPRR